MRLIGTCLISVLLLIAISNVSHGTTIDDFNAVDSALQSDDTIGRYMAADWTGMTDFQKTSFLVGLLRGYTTANAITEPLRSLEQRRKLTYLLKGWKMSPEAYVTEVQVVLENYPFKGRKRISVAFVIAESHFAAAAGQTERASRLESAWLDLAIAALGSEKTDILSEESDGVKMWHQTVGANQAKQECMGFTEGVALYRACLAAGVTDISLFRVGQLKDAIDALLGVPADDTRLLCLTVKAAESLAKQATAK